MLKKGEIVKDFEKRVVVAICPFCGKRNECGFDGDGRLMWWPQNHHCEHFRGVYSAGGLDMYALFEG